VESTLSTLKTGYLLILDTNCVCMVLAEPDGEEERTLDDMIDACSLCRDLINQSLGAQVTIAISDPSTSIFDLPKLFSSAEQAASSPYMSWGNRIILASEVSASGQTNALGFDCLNGEIARILDEGTKQDILPLVDRYLAPDTHAWRSPCETVLSLRDECRSGHFVGTQREHGPRIWQ
jgi:hypothetical protein